MLPDADIMFEIPSWPTEKWRAHEKLPGYLVSNLGRIWHIKMGELVQQVRYGSGFIAVLCVYGRYTRMPVEELRDEIFGIRSTPGIWPREPKRVKKWSGPMHALKAEQVREIKRTLRENPKINKSMIARDYGVADHIIYGIAKGRTWRHIDG